MVTRLPRNRARQFWRRYREQFHAVRITEQDVMDQARLTILAYGELAMWEHLVKWMRVVTVVMVMFVSPVLAQELPVCTTANGLQWELNTEPDMARYHIYKSTTPESIVVGLTPPYASVNHEPETLPDGTMVIQTTIPIPIEDGPTYFAVTALDTSENESPLSNEVGCVIEFPPNAPTGLMIIQFVSP